MARFSVNIQFLSLFRPFRLDPLRMAKFILLYFQKSEQSISGKFVI